MSRIAPTSSVAGKPRRITANWSFEHNHSGPPPIIAQSNVGPYYLQLDSRMTDVHDRKQEVRKCKCVALPLEEGVCTNILGFTSEIRGLRSHQSQGEKMLLSGSVLMPPIPTIQAVV